MASLGHVAVGMAAGRFAQPYGSSWARLVLAMLFWSGLSILPDADVLGFRLGIDYGDSWGHRGATHSLAFSALGGVVVGLGAASLGLPALRNGALAGAVLASHALLDTLTDGGLGCALFWPWSEQRFFAPWRPLPVAPIGRHFFSSTGLYIVVTELVVFAPLLAYALYPRRRDEAMRRAFGENER